MKSFSAGCKLQVGIERQSGVGVGWIRPGDGRGRPALIVKVAAGRNNDVRGVIGAAEKNHQQTCVGLGAQTQTRPAMNAGPVNAPSEAAKKAAQTHGVVVLSAHEFGRGQETGC